MKVNESNSLQQSSQQLNQESNKKLIQKSQNILFQFEDSQNDSDQIQIQNLDINGLQKQQTKNQKISDKIIDIQIEKPEVGKQQKFFSSKIQARDQSPSKIVSIKSQVVSISPNRFKKRKIIGEQQISESQNSQKNQFTIIQKQITENTEDRILMQSSSFELNSINKNQFSSSSFYNQLKETSQYMSPLKQYQKQLSPQKLFTKFNSQYLNEDILTPNEKQLKASQIYSKVIFFKLKDQSNKQRQINSIHKFTSKPLQGSYSNDFVRFLFEVHIYKYYFSTDYELWLRNAQGQMIKLLKAEKDPLGYRSSCLMIYQVSQSDKQQKIFTSKLNYNIAKNEYHLYDVDEITYPDKPRQMIATILYWSPYTNVQKKYQLYIPKSQNYSQDFVRTKANKNLLSYKQTNKISLMSSYKLSTQQICSLKEEFELKKSQRVLCLENQNKKKKLFIGKIQANRYIMIVGKGITPMQAFAMAIVNFEH